jgi:protein SCO1/2
VIGMPTWAPRNTPLNPPSKRSIGQEIVIPSAARNRGPGRRHTQNAPVAGPMRANKRSGRTTKRRRAVAGWSVIACLLALALVACRPEPPLQSFGPAPSFSLVDQSGHPFGSADLAGRVALANFIYTSCTDTCPLLSATMGQVQEQLRGDGTLGNKAVLLSFTLDPERDTPQVLTTYGERFGVDAAGWRMLTGTPDQLGQLAQDFKLGRPIPLPLDARNPLVNLMHSNRFVLIDPNGQVRAYYSGESLDVQEVVRDMRRLAR